MNASIASARLVARVRFVPVVLTAAMAIAAATAPVGFGASPSESPAAAVSPAPTTSTEAVCESAGDLRLIVGFLRETSISEDGVVPTLVGSIAALSEARRLAGLVGETYRPLVEDLVASLQGLSATVDELERAGTVGAGVAEIGEALSDIGNAMDALEVALREPCPGTAPDASMPPAEPASSAGA